MTRFQKVAMTLCIAACIVAVACIVYCIGIYTAVCDAFAPTRYTTPPTTSATYSSDAEAEGELDIIFGESFPAVDDATIPVDSTPCESTALPTDPSDPPAVSDHAEAKHPVKPAPTTEPTEATEPELTEPEPITINYSVDIPKTDLEMLACIIYREGGSDQVCDECRRRIGNVVLNRVASEQYPDNIYDVLTEYMAYGDISWNGLRWYSSASNPANHHAVVRAYEAAQWLLDGNRTNVDGLGWYGQAEFPQGVEQFKCCGIYFSRFRT